MSKSGDLLLAEDLIPLLRAALGDALGAGVEGGRALARAHTESPDEIGRRFFPFSPFRFAPRELTDDTQMAWAAFCELQRGLPDLSTAQGRLEYLEGVGSAYRAWFGSCPPDVGGSTADSLGIRSIDGGWRSWAGGQAAGNGSLMRATAQYVAGYRGESLLVAAALDSRVTHPDPRCVAACVWYSATIAAARELDDPSQLDRAMRSGLHAVRGANIETWLTPG